VVVKRGIILLRDQILGIFDERQLRGGCVVMVKELGLVAG